MDTRIIKDSFDKNKVIKEFVPDLPFRILLVGKSQMAGKTNQIGNFVMRPMDENDKTGNYYRNDFKPEDIYVVCPSIRVDKKWQDIILSRQIPPSNIMTSYDEDDLNDLYSQLEANFVRKESNGLKPEHSLIILDDCSFSGSLKKKMNGVLTKIACNGRHSLISLIVSAQKYTDLPTTLRENATCCMFWSCSEKQLDLVAKDHNMIKKKDFIRLFQDATAEPHSTFVVSYKGKDRYLDPNFKP